MTVEPKTYRYISKQNTYATRWRAVPSDGIIEPSKKVQQKLGDGYSLQLRIKRVKK